MLGLFAGNVDLEEPVDFSSGFTGNTVDRSGQCLTVDAVEKRKEGESLADFVFLQVAEEVPFESWRAGWDFFPGFLHAVLAEDSLASGGGGLNGLGGVRFGDRDEAPARRAAVAISFRARARWVVMLVIRFAYAATAGHKIVS